MGTLLSSPQGLVLLTCTLLAVYFDLRSGKIPNGLTLTTGLIILGLNFLMQGSVFFLYSLLTALAIFIIFLIPFHLNWLGGGDIKLLMVVGAYCSYPLILHFLLYISLGGGIIVIILFGLKPVLKNWQRKKQQPVLILKMLEERKVPYSLGILLGLFLV